jgi:hypothetical protein
MAGGTQLPPGANACKSAISINQPIADLDYPFALINIAVAKGCYKLAVGDC